MQETATAEVSVEVRRPGLEDLYRSHAPPARRVAYLVCGDHALAEDLVQEAFVKLCGRFVHVRHADAFGAYLRRCVINGAFAHHRSAGRERGRVETVARGSVGAGSLPDPASRVGLQQALIALPSRQRAAVVLKYWGDLSEREIAFALGCRQGTVKSLLSRGLLALREELGEDDDGTV